MRRPSVKALGKAGFAGLSHPTRVSCFSMPAELAQSLLDWRSITPLPLSHWLLPAQPDKSF
ncbi:hypothetical protein GH733_000493 [Mirounga leonina]|nr:hypothetical protein GH733_000493 [Mirounga leonina]